VNGDPAEDLALLVERAERSAPVDGADVLPPAIGGCLVILAGRLDLVRCDDERCIATLGPSSVVGGLPAPGREVLLRAVGSAEIARLGAEAIDELLEWDSNQFAAIAERIAETERAISLAIHLSRLFPGLERDGLDGFGAGVNWVALRGGEVLFEQDDVGDAAYLVISGRLRAVVSEAGGERVLKRDRRRRDRRRDGALLRCRAFGDPCTPRAIRSSLASRARSSTR
jgi:CRP-like cAMP-binding protein